jgi:hexosaminidase
MNTDADPIVLLPVPRWMKRLAGLSTAPVEEFIDPAIAQPQGYYLWITPGNCRLIAHDSAGIFYGRQTIAQLRRQFPQALPCMEIRDFPDFPIRGVMLDISRDKVPTMPTLLALVDRLAEWKINHLQLYIEHTFAYRGHEEVWQSASPMTPEEIRELDQFCKARFIDLVPNQNSFGHMERWLKHPRYLPLAEAPDGSETPWGFRWKGPFSLCPTDPRSLELLQDLYSQFLPNFSSKLCNVGCDETFDIGQGRSKQQAEQRGVHQVYLDFLCQVNDLISKHGRRMMFWGDIILHEPKLIERLPHGAIAMNWGYEANHPFDAEASQFSKSGVEFYVCPGTSSWCSIAGRTDNMLANQLAAAQEGLAHGAAGYLNTDWGDYGHLQYLPMSYAGLATGAGMSWCLESNRNLPLAQVLDVHVFADAAGLMGALAYELGNVYKVAGKIIHNRSPLFSVLVPTSIHTDPMEGITRENMESAEAAIDAAMRNLPASKMQREDADLIKSEFENAAAMLRFACRKGKDKTQKGLQEELEQIIQHHRHCWLARNRPGGLDDSAARLSHHAGVKTGS